MKQIKKIFTVLLMVTMLLGLIPAMPALAESITSISFDVVAPEAGRNPRYEYNLYSNNVVVDEEGDPYYSDYIQNGIVWFCGDDLMPSTDVYEVGKEYTVLVSFMPANAEDTIPTYPNPSPTITINGKEGYIHYSYSKYITVQYTFPALTGHSVTFVANGGGGTMATVNGVAGDYTIPNCDFTAPSGKVFKSWLIGSEEWFPGQTCPVFSDITATALWKPASTKTQVSNVVATSSDLNSVPVLYGKMKIPTFTITEGAPAYITASGGNFRWQKKIEGVWKNQSSGYFTPGEWRIQSQVRIDNDDALTHELSGPFSFTVNGQSWEADSNGEPYVDYNYSMIFVYSPTYVIYDDPNKQPPIKVTNAAFSIEGYYDGCSVANIKVVSNAQVNIMYAKLGEVLDTNNDGIPDGINMPTGNLSSKKNYAIFFGFVAKDGYDIAELQPEHITLDCSSSTMNLQYSQEDDSYECIFLITPPQSINVTLSKTSFTYNGKVQKPSVTVKDSNGNKISSSKYTVTYSSGSKSVGTYKVTVTMKDSPSCKKTATYKIKAVDISKCKISLSATKYTYNGKVRKPSVTVKDANGKKLTENKEYTVSYSSGCKKVGSYKVTVKMKGDYSGTKAITFKINPKGTTVSKLTAGNKKLNVSIKKASGVSGYEVEYSLKSNFKSSKKKATTTPTVTIKSLKAKKTYYVRVRTYKTVKGKKYYSSWSAYKYKKTK